MSEKVVGYILLLIGLAVILFSAISVYGAFKNRVVPINYFDLQGVSIQANTQAGIPEMEIVSKNSVNGVINLMAYVVLMGFIGGVGHKIASLGVGLLRPVAVRQK